jgi:hypothetical protein
MKLPKRRNRAASKQNAKHKPGQPGDKLSRKAGEYRLAKAH